MGTAAGRQLTYLSTQIGILYDVLLSRYTLSSFDLKQPVSDPNVRRIRYQRQRQPGSNEIFWEDLQMIISLEQRAPGEMY